MVNAEIFFVSQVKPCQAYAFEVINPESGTKSLCAACTRMRDGSCPRKGPIIGQRNFDPSSREYQEAKAKFQTQISDAARFCATDQ